MIRFLVALLFLIPMLGIIIGCTLGFLHDMYGLPYNPFKWAQERRRRVERARERRISVLEHDLGYRPCSDERCRECKMVAEGIPLPPPPTAPPGLTRLTQLAYDRQVEASRQARFKRGTASGGPL